MLDHALPSVVLPHTETARRLRHAVAEIKDLSRVRESNYIANVVWAAAVRNDSAIQIANDSAKDMLDAIPYIKRMRETTSGNGRSVEAREMTGEELMRKFMQDREEEKKALGK